MLMASIGLYFLYGEKKYFGENPAIKLQSRFETLKSRSLKYNLLLSLNNMMFWVESRIITEKNGEEHQS